MINVPDWIKQIVEQSDLKCMMCDYEYKLKDLVSLGVQNDTKTGRSSSEFLCIGMRCSKCQEVSNIDIGKMTLIDFAMEVLDFQDRIEEELYKSRREIQQKKRTPPEGSSKDRKKVTPSSRGDSSRSSISKKDQEEAIQTLKKISHEEFLLLLGMTPEEIREYDYKKNKKEDDKKK